MVGPLALAVVLGVSLGLLAACGAGTGASTKGPESTDPHQGWVRVDDYTTWRCIGPDKVVKTEGHGNLQQDVAANSEDCR